MHEPPAPNLPSRTTGTVRAWFVLLLILLLCLPSLTLGTAERLSTHTMENVALVTSQETWLRMAAGEKNAWLVSTNDGVGRLEKPPMLAWLNLLAWRDLDPATATPQQLTFRARCVTAALGLIMLASIYWMGAVVGCVRFAAFATLMVGSTFFFQRQARTASYDIHYVAWTTLAVAAGLWAMGPLQSDSPTLGRRMLGWGLCMTALTAAVMSKNPLPYLLALPPLISAIVFLSQRRRADALWLTAAALLSAVPVAAWYWHVFAEYHELAERELQREVRQPRTGDFQVVYYYLGLFGLVVPWTLWLVGGLIEPFKMHDRTRRRIAKFALCWFACIFIGLSIPAAKQQRYILAIMPAVGLLISAFFREHDERASQERRDTLFDAIAAGTWIVLAVGSLLAPIFFAHQDWFVKLFAQWLEQPGPVVVQVSWLFALLMTMALLAICVFGWRWRAKAPWKSGIAMALWMLVLMTVYWRQEGQIAARRIQAFVDETARIRAIVGDAQLYSLRWNRKQGTLEEEPDFFWKNNEEFRFYFGRLIHRVWRDQFDDWLSKERGEVFLMLRPTPEAAEKIAFLKARGFTHIDDAQVDTGDRQEIWHHP